MNPAKAWKKTAGKKKNNIRKRLFLSILTEEKVPSPIQILLGIHNKFFLINSYSAAGTALLNSALEQVRENLLRFQFVGENATFIFCRLAASLTFLQHSPDALQLRL